MAKAKSQKKASGAQSASEAWGPLAPEEVQAERAEQLVYELENAKHDLAETKAQRTALAAHIRELKQEIKTAKRLSKKQRARINTLDTKWRRQWVKYYDEFLARPAGYGPSDAAALAWTRVKVHCEQDPDGAWKCPPWEEVYGQIRKGKLPKRVAKKAKAVQATQAKKRARKKKAKKGP